jgi:tRNA A37 threonylcarbamoyladenosine biosynthesis protein TsaE
VNYPYKGKIDEVVIFDSSIEFSRIKEIYFAGLNNLLASAQITVVEYSERLAGMQNEPIAVKEK